MQKRNDRMERLETRKRKPNAPADLRAPQEKPEAPAAGAGPAPAEDPKPAPATGAPPDEGEPAQVPAPAPGAPPDEGEPAQVPAPLPPENETDFLGFPAVTHAPARCPNCGSARIHTSTTKHRTDSITVRWHHCLNCKQGKKPTRFRSVEELGAVDTAEIRRLRSDQK